MKKKLSVVIPVFNEEKTVKTLLKKVVGIKLPKTFTKEIIVVDDGSFDETGKILRSFKNKALLIIWKKKNEGKGSAIREGIKKATGEYLIIQDADLEYDPIYFNDLLGSVVENKAKVVYGTRLKNYPLKFWGNKKTVLPSHLIGNKLLTYLTNILYKSNLSDIETCYKLMHRDIYKQFDLKENKFECEPEITAKILKRGIKIFEVPIKVTPRTKKEGKKISWKDGFGAVYTLIKYKFID